MAPVVFCMYVLSMVVSHNWHGNQNRSPIIARLGGAAVCSCRILFQAYFIATQRRKGNPEQNAYISLMVWFKATVEVLFRAVGVDDALCTVSLL
jgi:hypothetical protein